MSLKICHKNMLVDGIQIGNPYRRIVLLSAYTKRNKYKTFLKNIKLIPSQIISSKIHIIFIEFDHFYSISRRVTPRLWS
jgi:hypothetical protein